MSRAADDPGVVDPLHGYCAGMNDALRRIARTKSGLLKTRLGPPAEEDRPPPSTFPATPASREAMRITRENKWFTEGRAARR